MTTPPAAPHLDRGLNTLHATSLNVANMLGMGPFITIPGLLLAMGGPQAMLGWVVAMLVVLCDGLIWSELAAALPGSGGTYHYLRVIFAGSTWGRLLPFLFIWQFLVSGTLEMASGYKACANFVIGLWPSLKESLGTIGVPEAAVFGVPATLFVFAVFLSLRREIRSLGILGTVLCAGTLVAVATVIVSGARHFDPTLITLPPDAFRLDLKFVSGLGGAMAFAIYDYLGYYNICHLGEEVREPEKTIPRAILISIVLVAAIYMSMNVAFIGVVPWQEAIREGSPAHENIAGAFMSKLYGEGAAAAFTALVVWAALAGLFAMTLGYSRIVYAAARNGDFFATFALLHPARRYPGYALALLSLLTAVFCFLPLQTIIEGAVTVRILVQFIGQIVALHVLRRQRANQPLPFRMWLYPAPCLLAFVGWTFVLGTAKPLIMLFTLMTYATGCLAFVVRDRFVRRRA